MRETLFFAALLLASGSLWAVDVDDLLIPSLTIEDYTAKAIQLGTRGRLTASALQVAGYSRDISFRQTDSPDLTAAHAVSRSEITTNGNSVLADSKATSLRLHQPTPLGTNILAVGAYNDANKPALSASLTQPLYIFTKNSTGRTRRRADLNFGNARDQYDADVLSIQTQARSLYYDVMLAHETIKVEERKATSSQKLLDITQALVQAGKKAAVETMRAKLRKQSDDRQLQNARVNKDKAISNAMHFVAMPPDQLVQFTTRLGFRPFRPSLPRILEYAFEHRPQLSALRRNQELARLNVQETVEITRPGIAVNSSVGYSELEPYTTRTWALGGGATWLFFDSFVNSKRTRSAKIDQFVADLNLSEAERVLELNVTNAFRDVKNAERQITDFQSSREQARHNVEVIRLRFQNGLERLIDVFDAENDMRDLENEYLGLLVTYNRAIDNLSELIGGDVWGVR